MMIRIATLLICYSALLLNLKAQHIEPVNSSFEGQPSDATVPQGWMACSERTTPDILPGYWGVYTDPSDGNTYVGLITRDDGTNEIIGQRLSEPLKSQQCYSLSLDLSHADTYSGYSGPVKLRVYVSEKKCGDDQMVYESPLIEHTYWKTYTFKFKPEQEARYLKLEAFHSEDIYSYKGNILVDHIRAIRGCDKT